MLQLYYITTKTLDHYNRLVVGEDAGLECKTVSAYNADKWANGAVPKHYAMQCYHYMAVTGKRTWYIAAVILGKEFVYRKLEWNDEVISALIRKEEYFWNEYVLKSVMPPPDGSSACDEMITECYDTARKSSVIELVGFEDKLHQRMGILRQIDELQEEQKRIEQEIKLFMKDNEYGYTDNYNIAWRNIDSTRLDAKRMKLEQPHLYEQYSKVSHCRRFEIREAKNDGRIDKTA